MRVLGAARTFAIDSGPRGRCSNSPLLAHVEVRIWMGADIFWNRPLDGIPISALPARRAGTIFRRANVGIHQ